MALITCKECGGKMSDRATECPHCGCPIEIATNGNKTAVTAEAAPTAQKPCKKRKRQVVILTLVVIALLGAGAFICIKNDIFASETLKITPEFTKALERYDQIDAFSEGMAAVRRDGKWGYINLKGEEVIPCQFSDDFPVGQFSEGLACVVDERNPKDSALINKRVGFINKKGEWVIEGEYYSQIPHTGTAWGHFDHTLPSFKDGKCAVWNMAATDFWDDNNQYSKTVLIDHNGEIVEVADSISYKLSGYQPYPSPFPYIDLGKHREEKVAYDDYTVTIARDTAECDNGAELVTWQVMDANCRPFATAEEKTIQYFIDKYGNSTLTSAQEEAMQQHLNGLISSLQRQNEIYLQEKAEEERRQREEEERKRQREWLYGTWEYNGTIDMGRYLGGVKRVTSKLVISENNLRVINNGSVDYDGGYEIEDGRIVYSRRNGSAFVLPIDQSYHRIEFDRGKYYSKSSSSTSSYSSSYNSSYGSSYSSSSNFVTEADVWAYLSGRTFKGNGTSFRLCPQYLELGGSPATGAVRVSNIRGSTATLTASSPYLGGQTFRMYLNASNGTITSDGLTYYSR
ncbi:MAG: WG repeat-containing protein [Bacteroides sp.]|nr:WG repeat-containing protein [Bacteroides sp.]MCM1413876.1 WG repeat-containing protein [Bacteroides sp.]